MRHGDGGHDAEMKSGEIVSAGRDMEGKVLEKEGNGLKIYYIELVKGRDGVAVFIEEKRKDKKRS